MLKKSFSGMKKVLSILLVVLFVVSLTAVGASAKGGSYWVEGGHGHYDGHGYYGGYGDWEGYGGYSGCGWMNGAWVPAYGYPYI